MVMRERNEKRLGVRVAALESLESVAAAAAARLRPRLDGAHVMGLMHGFMAAARGPQAHSA